MPLPHSAQRKHTFLGEIKEMSKTKKLPSKNKIALELLHQRLGNRSTISFLSGDTAYVWKDIGLRIYLDPFFTSCQISSMKKRLDLKSTQTKITLQVDVYGYNSINSIQKFDK